MRYEILVDHGETANKCTIMPVSYRPDFAIRRVPNSQLIGGFTASVLLHPEGQSMALMDLKSENLNSLALIDCIWRRLELLLNRLEKPLPRLVSIPPEFVTAYPRVSRQNADPSGGLATIEALFIAAAFLGHWDTTLLCEYFFGDRFLELNRDVFQQFGIWPSESGEGSVFGPRYPRNSFRRRIARGRAATTV